jgi:hypothetical protein
MEETISTEREEIVSNREGSLHQSVSVKRRLYLIVRGIQNLLRGRYRYSRKRRYSTVRGLYPCIPLHK